MLYRSSCAGKCNSHNHSHHHGLEDSIYRQTQLQSAFYAQMRRLSVYVNQPDDYVRAPTE